MHLGYHMTQDNKFCDHVIQPSKPSHYFKYERAKCKRLTLIAIIDMIMEEEDEVNIKKKKNRTQWVQSWIARREQRGA